MKLGDQIAYTSAGGQRVCAVVRRKHRNGDVSVEPYFFLQRSKIAGTFQGGHLVRLSADGMGVAGAAVTTFDDARGE